MELQIVKVEKPENLNVILGMSHFIKTVEDLHEALVTAVPGISLAWLFARLRASGSSAKLALRMN